MSAETRENRAMTGAKGVVLATLFGCVIGVALMIAGVSQFGWSTLLLAFVPIGATAGALAYDWRRTLAGVKHAAQTVYGWEPDKEWWSAVIWMAGWVFLSYGLLFAALAAVLCLVQGQQKFYLVPWFGGGIGIAAVVVSAILLKSASPETIREFGSFCRNTLLSPFRFVLWRMPLWVFGDAKAGLPKTCYALGYGMGWLIEASGEALAFLATFLHFIHCKERRVVATATALGLTAGLLAGHWAGNSEFVLTLVGTVIGPVIGLIEYRLAERWGLLPAPAPEIA